MLVTLHVRRLDNSVTVNSVLDHSLSHYIRVSVVSSESAEMGVKPGPEPKIEVTVQHINRYDSKCSLFA